MYLQIDMTQKINKEEHDYTFFIELSKDGMKELKDFMNEIAFLSRDPKCEIKITRVKQTIQRLTNW